MQKVIITQHNATETPERRKLLYGHQSFIIWFTAAVHAIIDDPKSELQSYNNAKYSKMSIVIKFT
jgi:hypothetical protein